MIIIYGNDERNSVTPAQLLIQKGFENIYLLTGGIEEFIKTYPEKCEGPGVQVLINRKMQDDILKKDGISNY